MVKRPYEHFQVELYQEADVTVDTAITRKAAGLLELPDDKSARLHTQTELIARRYHGTPAATNSAEGLKVELGEFHKALIAARELWALLSFDAKRLVREQYVELRLPVLPHETEVSPTSLFGYDEMALLRVSSRTGWALDEIVPNRRGPAPSPLQELAEWALGLSQILVGHPLKFGTSNRAPAETGSGHRSPAYHACVLLMQAVDTTLSEATCEGPLEAALRADRKSRKTRREQVDPEANES